jgi:hypothetical protein
MTSVVRRFFGSEVDQKTKEATESLHYVYAQENSATVDGFVVITHNSRDQMSETHDTYYKYD